MSCKRRASRSCASPSSCRYWRSRSAKRWRKRTWPTAEIRWCNLRREQARVGLDQAPHQAKIMVKRERAAHTFGSRPYGARSPLPLRIPPYTRFAAPGWRFCGSLAALRICTSTDRDRREGRYVFHVNQPAAPYGTRCDKAEGPCCGPCGAADCEGGPMSAYR